MHALNLTNQKTCNECIDKFYIQDNYYLILSTPCELNKLQRTLNIDEITFKDCLSFDDNIKLDLFEKYDFLSLNTFEIKDTTVVMKEVNIYLSDNYILAVVDDNHFIYNYIYKMIYNCFIFDKNPKVTLFKINYFIFKEIIVKGFENIEKLEDIILDIEDRMLASTNEKHFAEISSVRSLARSVVKSIRPLLYIGDRILNENIRYLNNKDIKKYNLENLQSIDFGIDRLYNFAISTRELADKLLDIYSSRIGERTNSLITKLTILTAIAAPLTIITGIYGMNFVYMPWLQIHYAYYITIGVMLLIVILGCAIFKIKKYYKYKIIVFFNKIQSLAV